MMSSQSSSTTTPSAPPTSFKYERDVCALSWWEPVKLLEEGSISDIHLVKRRDKFLKVKYKDKRNVMALAKNQSTPLRRFLPKKLSRSGALFRKDEKNGQQQQQQVDDDDDIEFCVLKSIHKDHIGDESVLEEMRSEILVMSHLRHPNIINLYEAYERRRHVYLVMEYCPGGNLTKFRNSPEPRAKRIVRDVCSALEYMHSKGVAHRDIKLENIMFDRHGQVKMIDFGLATKYLSNEYSNMTDMVGTLYSMAPEVIEHEEYDAQQTDMWSVGVVTYMLLSGQEPFWGPNEAMSWVFRRRHMMRLIQQCDYTPMTGERWDNVSDDAKRFIIHLLAYEPDRRLTASQALASPWLSSLANDDQVDNGEAVTSMEQSSATALGDYRLISMDTEFRRNAWHLLASNLTQDEAIDLQKTFETLDTLGQGSVPVPDMLQALREMPSLSNVNDGGVDRLADEFYEQEGMAADNNDDDGKAIVYCFPYIDFVIEVQKGVRRTLQESLASILDDLDTTGTRTVSSNALASVFDDNSNNPAEQRGAKFPVELKMALRTKLPSLEDEKGNVSTVEVLEWFGRRIAHQTRDSVRSLPQSECSA